MASVAFYAGLFLVALGLAGLALFVRKALAVRRGSAEKSSAAMNRLVALNMAAVGTAFFGLALVVVGLILG